MSGATPAGYDEEVAPPASATANPKGYDEEVPPPQQASGSLPAPPSVEASFPAPVREGLLGLASGIGIPESMTPIRDLAKTIPHALGPPQTTGEKIGLGLGIPPPLYRAGAGLVEGVKQAGTDIGTGLAKMSLGEEGGGAQASHGGGQALGILASLYSAKKAPEVLGAEKATAKTINKLAYATSAKSIRPLEHLLPEIKQTIAQAGEPKTVGQMYQTIQDTSSRLENQFNTSLQQMGTQPIHTQAIADALKAKADALPRSAALEAAGLRNEARLYDGQVTTAKELNADRMYRSDNLQSFYKKDLTGQMAASRSSAQAMADKIVYDNARDILYSEMDQRFPGQDFQELKRKQSSVLDMLGDFKDHVESLEAAQAKRAGAPLSEKASMSASAHPSGSIVTPRFHGLMNLLPGGGPLVRANQAIATAFNPAASTMARRAAILALPVTALTDKGGRPSAIPPPPQSTQNEQGPQQ